MTEPHGYLVRELGPETWTDFEKLFAKHGGVGACWCMYYQRPHGYTTKGLSAGERYEKNRRSKKSLVNQDRSHGILLYDRDKAVGWCAYGLKNEFPRIDSGRNYRRLGLQNRDSNLWRITCFFVDRDYRKRGVARLALKATMDSIKRKGGGTVEAYPVTAKASKEWSKWSNWFWFGTASMFAREKFKAVGQMGPHHLLMRRTIRPSTRT
jgi:GNAT superfamily N-acetyltransferase